MHVYCPVPLAIIHEFFFMVYNVKYFDLYFSTQQVKMKVTTLIIVTILSFRSSVLAGNFVAREIS